MKLVKIIGAALVALFVLLTAVGFLLPSHAAVQRSIVIDAAPETIYPLIANLEEGWAEWSPWHDPVKYQSRYTGPKEGVGATHTFEDNGKGQLTIVKADPKTGVEYDLLLMNESFRLKSSLLCAPRDGKTEVTWSDDVDYGSNPYYRYFGLMIEGPLGEELEKGLSKLKVKAEERAKKNGV
jgi:hypothetical protein